MTEPKPGEIITDGKNVTIGAPLVKSIAGPPPSQILAALIRNLHAVVGRLAELQAFLEQQERK